MNKVILTGRLTHNPELRYTPNSQTATSTFSLAVNRDRRDDGADFFSIVVWGKTAENVCKYMAKGSQVGVVGRLQTRNYTDNDGNKRYVTEVIADTVEFLGTKQQAQTEQ